MAKKISSDTDAPAAPKFKRTPEEKAQRKADKAQQKATKTLADDHNEKKASQKQTLKAAAKQLQKELDNRMSELVTRIRKETKAKLKDVIQEATQRLDLDTEQLFEQALHTIVKHYDTLAPGRTSDINIPAPAAAGKPAANGKKGKANVANALATNVATEAAPTSKRSGQRAAPAAKQAAGMPTATSRSRAKSKTAASEGPELNTPLGTSNDSVAVDNA